MYPAISLFTKVITSILTSLLTSISLLGNGTVLLLIARFKSLRTVPNVFITNLALVDLLNSAINLPIAHIIHTFIEASWLKSRNLAIVVTFFSRLFAVLNLASMLAMMTDMYLAISHDLRYFVWKTKQKALIGVSLIWIISIVMVTWLSVPLLDIDLGEVHVHKYRKEIFEQGRYFVAVMIALFILCVGVLGFLTARSIQKKKKKVF